MTRTKHWMTNVTDPNEKLVDPRTWKVGLMKIWTTRSISTTLALTFEMMPVVNRLEEMRIRDGGASPWTSPVRDVTGRLPLPITSFSP